MFAGDTLLDFDSSSFDDCCWLFVDVRKDFLKMTWT